MSVSIVLARQHHLGAAPASPALSSAIQLLSNAVSIDRTFRRKPSGKTYPEAEAICRGVSRRPERHKGSRESGLQQGSRLLANVRLGGFPIGSVIHPVPGRNRHEPGQGAFIGTTKIGDEGLGHSAIVALSAGFLACSAHSSAPEFSDGELAGSARYLKTASLALK
jgi:hypothetical protein